MTISNYGGEVWVRRPSSAQSQIDLGGQVRRPVFSYGRAFTNTGRHLAITVSSAQHTRAEPIHGEVPHDSTESPAPTTFVETRPGPPFNVQPTVQRHVQTLDFPRPSVHVRFCIGRGFPGAYNIPKGVPALAGGAPRVRSDWRPSSGRRDASFYTCALRRISSTCYGTLVAHRQYD